MTVSIHHSRPAEILLVDDNEIDIELTRLALQKIRFPINLSTVGDGEQCIDLLRKNPPYTTAITPALVLLDLNMPRMGGLEVLERRANDAILRQIPFVVLTTSSSRADIHDAYNLGCNSYVTKPLEFHHYVRTLRSLFKYWLVAATLPANGVSNEVIGTSRSNEMKQSSQ